MNNSQEQRTNLLKAINANDLDAVKNALQFGAAADGEPPRLDPLFQTSPLHLAISQGRDAIVSLLLQHGADPLQRGDNTPWSPMMLASILSQLPARRHRPARVSQGCRKIIKILESAGATDREAEGILGRTDNEKRILTRVKQRRLKTSTLVFDAEGLIVEYPDRLRIDPIGKFVQPFPLIEVMEANRLTSVVEHLKGLNASETTLNS